MNGINDVQIQLLTCEPVRSGHVGFIVHNCPVVMFQPAGATEDNAAPIPGFQLSAEQAKDLGMELIYLAKVAEQRAQGATNGNC
jgi:hypothetical protein